jgi:hypothetical protein
MPFEIPEDIRYVRVDPKSGLLAPEQSDHGVVEVFNKGTEPTETAPDIVDPADFYRLDQIPEAYAAPLPAPAPPPAGATAAPSPVPLTTPGMAAPGPARQPAVSR